MQLSTAAAVSPAPRSTSAAAAAARARGRTAPPRRSRRVAARRRRRSLPPPSRAGPRAAAPALPAPVGSRWNGRPSDGSKVVRSDSWRPRSPPAPPPGAAGRAPAQAHRDRDVVGGVARLQLRRGTRGAPGRTTAAGGLAAPPPATARSAAASAARRRCPALLGKPRRRGRRRVGASKTLRTGSSRPKVSRTRDTSWVASSECPPRAKKSAAAPARSTRRRPAARPTGASSTSSSACAAPRRTPPPSSPPAAVRRRQGPAVHLAAGGVRQLRQRARRPPAPCRRAAGVEMARSSRTETGAA